MALPDDMEEFVKSFVKFISRSLTFLVELKNDVVERYISNRRIYRTFEGIYTHMYNIVVSGRHWPRVPVFQMVSEKYFVLVNTRNLYSNTLYPPSVQSLIADRFIYMVLSDRFKTSPKITEALQIMYENNMFRYLPEVYKVFSRYAEPAYRNSVEVDLKAVYKVYPMVELDVPKELIYKPIAIIEPIAPMHRVIYYEIITKPDISTGSLVLSVFSTTFSVKVYSGDSAELYYGGSTDTIVRSAVALLSIVASPMLAAIKAFDKLSKVIE